VKCNEENANLNRDHHTKIIYETTLSILQKKTQEDLLTTWWMNETNDEKRDVENCELNWIIELCSFPYYYYDDAFHLHKLVQITNFRKQMMMMMKEKNGVE
jgi:hypothetical protein